MEFECYFIKKKSSESDNPQIAGNRSYVTTGIFTCGSCVNLKENRLVEQGCSHPWARKRPRGGSSNRDTSAVHTGRVPFFGPVGRTWRKDRWKR